MTTKWLPGHQACRSRLGVWCFGVLADGPITSRPSTSRGGRCCTGEFNCPLAANVYPMFTSAHKLRSDLVRSRQTATDAPASGASPVRHGYTAARARSWIYPHPEEEIHLDLGKSPRWQGHMCDLQAMI